MLTKMLVWKGPVGKTIKPILLQRCRPGNERRAHHGMAEGSTIDLFQ